ncbi:sigma factor-like helix-turn-helix DNA-binding protein [Priestia aryabhattai]
MWPLYIKGYSYIEISQVLNIPEKSIDNAIQRIKRKVGRNLGIKQAI